MEPMGLMGSQNARSRVSGLPDDVRDRPCGRPASVQPVHKVHSSGCVRQPEWLGSNGDW